MARATLVKNGQVGNGFEKSRGDGRQGSVEELGGLRPAKNQQMARAGRRGREGEKLRAHGNAGDFSVAEVPGSRGKVDRSGLYAFAHQPIGEARHRVWLERHSGDLELDGCGHAGTGSIPAHYGVRAK